MTDAIVLEGVTKSFGSKVAVRELDLVVPAGLVYGFIGPNGAGKTTTLRLILSMLLPDRGQIRVLGASALAAKDRIGYLPEERGVYRKMRVGAFLTYIARLKGLGRSAARRRAGEWLGRVGLADVERKRCEELSKGMQQKVAIAIALLHEPELLVLDEPFGGLDPVSQRLLRGLIGELRSSGTTILLSTHVMAHAEQLCDHVVMLHQGVKVLDAPIRDLQRGYDQRLLEIEPLDPAQNAERLREIHGVVSLSRSGASFQVELARDVDPAQAFREIVLAVRPARVGLKRKTLDDIFLELVSKAPRANGQPTTTDAAGPAAPDSDRS